ncbi:MAG TPA: hypothetical protein VLF94_06605 [Chlamydiales bacterium]|nr:hypothetical protein [Chlamydiales bacterium]
MIVKEDVLAFREIAKQREYTLGCALSDLTGVGTLYSLGADWANSGRLTAMNSTTKKVPPFNKLVKEYLTSTNCSLASKVGYLSSLAAAAAGFTAGVVGVASLATLFLMRAGYNSVSHASIEHRLAKAIGGKYE